MNSDFSNNCFFKAFNIVVESFESLPAAILFCWFKNECEMSKLENETGKFIYRSQKEIIEQFRSLGRRQVEQALSWLEEENLIIRERKQYGFLIQIHPDADAVIRSKSKEWQAEKSQKIGEKVSCQNVQIAYSEISKSNHENVHSEHSEGDKTSFENAQTVHSKASFEGHDLPTKAETQNVHSEHSVDKNVHSDARNVHSASKNVHSAFLLYKEQRRTNEELSRTKHKVRQTTKTVKESSSPNPTLMTQLGDGPTRVASEPSHPLNAGDDYCEELSQEELDYQDRQERDRKEADQYFDSLPDEWFQQEEDQLQKDMEAYQAMKADYPDYPTCPVSREHSYESVPWEELGDPEETLSVSDDTCQNSTDSELEERIFAPQEEPTAPKLKQPDSAAKEEMPQADSHRTHFAVQADKESHSDFPKPNSAKEPSSSQKPKQAKKKSAGKRKKKSSSKRLSKEEKEELLQNFAGEDKVLLDVLHSWVDIRLGKRAVESAGAYQRQFNLINECAREAKVSRAALVNHMVNKEWKGCYALDSNYAIENCKKEWKLYCRVHELSYADTVEWTMPVETPMWEYVSESGMKDDDLLQTPWYKLKPSEKARVNYLEDHPEMLINKRGLPIQKEKLDQCRKRRWEPKPEPAAYSGDDVLPF